MSRSDGSIVGNCETLLSAQFLNLIGIRGLLLIELEFLAYLMNNMVVCIHGFEIMDEQLVPLIGSLRKTIVFLLFIPLIQGVPQLQWVHLQHVLGL